MSRFGLEDRLVEILRKVGKEDAYRPVENYRKLLPEPDVGKQVHRFDFKPKSGFLRIVPLYDLHIGLKTVDEEVFDEIVDFIAADPDCVTILGGDAVESATRESVGLGMIEQKYHVQEQRRRVTEKLRPLAKAGKILGGLTGNHEMRVQRFNDDNPMAEICYDLEIPYWGYSAYLKLVVNDIPYHVFCHHGRSGATSRAGKINAALRLGQIAHADLYISGHTHERLQIPEIIYEIDDATDRLVARKRVHVIAGSLPEYFGGYAEMSAYPPSITGPVLIELSGTKKDIRVHL